MVLVFLIIVVGILTAWLHPWPLFPTQKLLEGGFDERDAEEFKKWVQRRAQERGLNVRGVARRIPLKCPRCGGSSHYFVYPDEVCERCWWSSVNPKPLVRSGGVSKCI